MTGDPPRTSSTAANDSFATTRWSMVLAAGRRSTLESDAALDALCRAYWYPLYAYARRKGHAAHDAADLTQGFFASLLERESLRAADPQRGRFRSFLLSCFNHYLINEHQRQHAQKRGGAALHLSIDVAEGEARYRQEPVDHCTPEAIYERRWALTLLEHVMRGLEEEYRARGKQAQFELLRPTLTGSADALPYAQLARQLAISEPAARVAVHRLRRRYAELLQNEILATLDAGQDPREEIQRLMQAVAGASGHAPGTGERPASSTGAG